MAGFDLAQEAEGVDPPLPPPNLPFLKTGKYRND